MDYKEYLSTLARFQNTEAQVMKKLVNIWWFANHVGIKDLANNVIIIKETSPV